MFKRVDVAGTDEAYVADRNLDRSGAGGKSVQLDSSWQTRGDLNVGRADNVRLLRPQEHTSANCCRLVLLGNRAASCA